MQIGQATYAASIAGLVGLTLLVAPCLAGSGIWVVTTSRDYLNGEVIRLDGALRMAPR
ncbi:hypothetical protein LV75_005176 [Actinokineospora diospyrosa]|uniref:Uncharacterized protein n=1 Tax=Actinokineospora diospyrosa TaxID=103728 RepID=A0ABT1IJ24_9PSEU|nr:hypothetical protein [Actinokineospora diospyrosa]